MTNWNSSKTGWTAGIIGMILALYGAVSDHAGLPSRVRAVEESTKSLSAGQQELTRRVDMMGANVVSLQKDVERNASRTEDSLNRIIGQLSGISGRMEDIRDTGKANEKDIVTVRQQALNALNIADDANRRAAEAEAIIKAKGTK